MLIFFGGCGWLCIYNEKDILCTEEIFTKDEEKQVLIYERYTYNTIFSFQVGTEQITCS